MSTVLHVLSAGAIEPGLVDAAEAFGERNDCEVKITWATTPVIRKRLGGGEVVDVVIATREAIDGFAREKKLSAAKVVDIGRVGIGMVVRDRAPEPDIASVGALKYAVLDADSVVFNRASSGLQVERILGEMGLLDRIQAKTSRYNNGPAMMEHLIKGKGKEIGFGAIVEILMFRDKGLKLSAPLPPEVQHYTEYAAAPMTAAPEADLAVEFVSYLGTQEAKAHFAACGVELE
jgi:molybdate transport system substrate-binding protein